LVKRDGEKNLVKLGQTNAGLERHQVVGWRSTPRDCPGPRVAQRAARAPAGASDGGCRVRLQSPWWAGVLTVVLRGCAETVSSIVMGEPQAAVVSQEELAEDQAMGEDQAPAPAGNEAAGEDVVVNVGPAGEPQAAVVSQGELTEDQAMGEDPAPAPAGNEAAGEDVVVNVGPADAAAEDPDEQVRQRLQERLLDPSRGLNMHFRSFKILARVGGGAFGTVFRVMHHKSGALMALKLVLLDTTLDTSEDTVTEATRKFSLARSEGLRLKQLQAEGGHPNIVLPIDCTHARIPGYVRSARARCG
jgi:hypothetical protein